MSAKNKEGMIQVTIETNGDDWHGMTSERVWASRVEGGRFRVENFPLYAYGVSYGDLVDVREGEAGVSHFVSVVEMGGHSTYRVLLRRGFSVKDFHRFWHELGAMGCFYESSRDPEDVFSIDVPPNVDVNEVYMVLERGVIDGLWYLDEGNFEHVAN